MIKNERRWYMEFNRYHWFVLIVCTLGWMFDCFDQQLFNMARRSAVRTLISAEEGDPRIDQLVGIATSVLLIGWATGGIIFGILGDRIGRAKTMIFTLLTYSVFSGLSGYAFTLWDFLALRFLAGLGVGGQFAVGVTLVSESVPDRTRTHALGMLQAFSAVGNILAGLVFLGALELIAATVVWRYIFTVTVIPALVLVTLVVLYLQEPEPWKKAVAERKTSGKKGSMFEMFTVPQWRNRAIIGLLLAASGVLGLWAIGVFSSELTQIIIKRNTTQEAVEKGVDKQDLALAVELVNSGDQLAGLGEKLQELNPHKLISADVQKPDAQMMATAVLNLYRQEKPVSAESVLAYLDKGTEYRKAQTPEDRARRAQLIAQGTLDAPALEQDLKNCCQRQQASAKEILVWTGYNLILFNIGAFFGIYAFAKVTNYIGRRPTFAIFFTIDLLFTVMYFLFMDSRTDLIWMAFLIGFAQLSVYGGYAIYFPELFPTRMRSTGTSFCYNIARYIGAGGATTLGWLSGSFYGAHLGFNEVDRFRYAGVTMCSCFLVGIVTLFFAPETKDQPLPE